MYNKHINLLVERTWQNIAADCAYLMYFILGLFQWELYILYKYIYMHVCVYERERERERERDPFTRCPVLSEKECLSCVIDTRNVCLIKPKWQVSIGSVYLASNHPNNNWEQQSSKSNRPSYFHGSQWWKTRVCPPNECQINREWKTGGFSLQQGESDTEMSSSHGGLCWCPVTEHVNSSGLFMKFHLHHHDCGSDCCIPTRHPFWIL